MARLTSFVVLALVAFTAAAPIASPQFDVSPGLGLALDRSAAVQNRDPALEPAAAAAQNRDPALEPAAAPPAEQVRDPALEPAAAPPAEQVRDPRLEPAAAPPAPQNRDPRLDPAQPPADRGREDDERAQRERADRDRAERERLDRERERGRDRGRGGNGRNQLDICVAALQQIQVNLAETGPQLRDLNAQFALNDAALAQLFGIMQAGLRGTQAASIKIAEIVARGGAAPAAERQIIITGLGGARDALARLDSGDRVIAGRLRQARASLRQTVVTANQILRNCGVGQDNGAVTSVVVTSTMAVPPEETGVPSVSLTSVAIPIPTPANDIPAPVTLSQDGTPISTVIPLPTEAPQVVPPLDNAACPPAVTVTAPAPPAVTVTVTAVPSGIVSSAIATPSAVEPISSIASAAPSGVVSVSSAGSAVPSGVAPSSSVASAAPSGAASITSAASAAPSASASVIATLRPAAPAARR